MWSKYDKSWLINFQMIKFLTIFIFLYSNLLNALEVKCNFEEVYQDGQIQQGILIMKNNLLRYQYSSDDLFTIFHDGQKFYALENQNLEKFQVINNNTKMLDELIMLAQKFPNIQKSYKRNNYHINIEKSLVDKFVKRISINSSNLNMSIYLHNCKFIPINNRVFEFDPLLVKIDS